MKTAYKSLGDGWLARAYNTTPETFGTARRQLEEHLRVTGKNPTRFPNATRGPPAHGLGETA